MHFLVILLIEKNTCENITLPTCGGGKHIFVLFCRFLNKKYLKNVGPIRHCEPPHAHSPGVASGTVARRLRIDVHDDNNDNA